MAKVRAKKFYIDYCKSGQPRGKTSLKKARRGGKKKREEERKRESRNSEATLMDEEVLPSLNEQSGPMGCSLLEKEQGNLSAPVQ